MQDAAGVGIPVACWDKCWGAAWVRYDGKHVFVWYGDDKLIAFDPLSGEPYADAELFTDTGTPITAALADRVSRYL